MAPVHLGVKKLRKKKIKNALITFTNVFKKEKAPLIPIETTEAKIKAEVKENAYSLLRRIGLEEKADVYPSTLSGGHKNKGISPAMLPLVAKMMESVDYMETNLNLEDNHAIRNMWKNFGCIQHKRRRCYIKQLNPTQE